MLELLDGVAELDGEMLFVTDEERFREETIVDISAAANSEDSALSEAASWLVWTASQSLGSGVGSLKGAYDTMGRSDSSGSRGIVACFEIPLSIAPTVARAVFSAADALDAGTICFSPRLDWASGSTSQRRSFLTNVLTAAIQKRWTLPVFFEAGPFVAHDETPRNHLDTLAASIDDGFRGISMVAKNTLDPCALRENAARRSEKLIELGNFARQHEPQVQPLSLTAAVELSEDLSRESLSSCAAQLGAASAKIGLSKFRLPKVDDALASTQASNALYTISLLADQLRAGNRIAGASVGGGAWLDDSLSFELLDCKTVEARLGTWLDTTIRAVSNSDNGASTFENAIEDRVRKLLDRLEQRGTRDFVRKHAIPMPAPRPKPATL